MFNIAIIGTGPRALWACEELFANAALHHVPVSVTVFGKGASQYDPALPSDYRLNVTSAIVRTALGSFDDWRLSHGESAPLDPFAPRARVGEFLADSWDNLRTHLPSHSSLTCVDREVSDVERVGEKWNVEGSLFDVLLLSTGHAHTWPGALTEAPDEVEFLGAAYEADYDSISGSDAVVAVRGAALTFIDAALSLRKNPAVRSIVPIARSGYFIEVKPDPNGELAKLQPAKESFARVESAADCEELRAVLADAAQDLLQQSGSSANNITEVIAGQRNNQDPTEQLRQSLAVARGEATPTAEWAIGQAWRTLYPSIVKRASFEGRDTLDGFAELAKTLEPIAFGPPPVNAEHLLDIIDAGQINTNFLASGDDLPEVLRQVQATHLIDAVLPPPGIIEGTLPRRLQSQGHLTNRQNPNEVLRGVNTDHNGFVIPPNGSDADPTLAAVGRLTEDTVVGNDTLSRTLHDVIPRWAKAVITNWAHNHPDLHGIPPLRGRIEPWAQALLDNPEQCQKLVEEFGSPVNVLNAEPMQCNIEELVAAGKKHGVDVKVFFARKANKGLTFVDRVRNLGHGVDVASERELQQVLDSGVQGDKIIVSSAIKPDSMLRLAISNQATISVDGAQELARISALARELETTANIAPRLACDPDKLMPTRFGERLDTWIDLLQEAPANIDIKGIHVHLHGYAAEDRAIALNELFALVEKLRAAGHHLEFVDLGGGIPMSYLDSEVEWENFCEAREAMNAGNLPAFTWKADPLSNVYPFHQEPTRGAWLEHLLALLLADGTPVADAFRRHNLRLHLEPGRSILDGCGLILAEVAFTKQRSDGLPLVGLAMNRTQLRTAADDYLIDPVLVRTQDTGDAVEAYMVGAYCIEDEIIVRRRMRFAQGVAAGDIIGFPNTAGYFMHILESASHQIPLAKNIVYQEGKWQLDRIDLA